MEKYRFNRICQHLLLRVTRAVKRFEKWKKDLRGINSRVSRRNDRFLAWTDIYGSPMVSTLKCITPWHGAWVQAITHPRAMLVRYVRVIEGCQDTRLYAGQPVLTPNITGVSFYFLETRNCRFLWPWHISALCNPIF